MTERIMFPMRYMNITTKPNELSHVGTNAIDVAGKDAGIENVYAPFSGVIKKVWPNGNTVWLESSAPVLFADGTTDYATANFTHDNDIRDLPVDRVVRQGEPFYQEGMAGRVTGNHVHISIARGKFTGTGWYQNTYGIWELNNSINPTLAFWLGADTVVINSRGLTFKRAAQSAQEEEVKIANDGAWKTRMAQVLMEITGDVLTDNEFQSWVGAEPFRIVEALIDDKARAAKNDGISDAESRLKKIRELVG